MSGLPEPDYLEEDDPLAAHVGQVREQKVRAPLGAQAGAETFVVLPVQVDHGVAYDELAGDLLYLLAGFGGKTLEEVVGVDLPVPVTHPRRPGGRPGRSRRLPR